MWAKGAMAMVPSHHCLHSPRSAKNTLSSWTTQAFFLWSCSLICSASCTIFSTSLRGTPRGTPRGGGSSAHTNLDHLYTQAFLTYCAMHSGSSAHTRFLSSGSSVHTHTFGRVGGGGGIGKHTRSSAPAQHCGGGGAGGGGGGGMASTPAQVHPLSAVSACGRVARGGGGHPLRCTRSALSGGEW